MGGGKFIGWLSNNKDWLGQTAGNLIGSFDTSSNDEVQTNLPVMEKSAKTDAKQNTMIYVLAGVVVLFMLMRKK